jgi:hypothetical protein
MSPIDDQQVISETCRCGGSFSVTAPMGSARAAVTEWRLAHPCVDRKDALSKGSSGGGSTLGFAVAPHRVKASTVPIPLMNQELPGERKV